MIKMKLKYVQPHTYTWCRNPTVQIKEIHQKILTFSKKLKKQYKLKHGQVYHILKSSKSIQKPTPRIWKN